MKNKSVFVYIAYDFSFLRPQHVLLQNPSSSSIQAPEWIIDGIAKAEEENLGEEHFCSFPFSQSGVYPRMDYYSLSIYVTLVLNHLSQKILISLQMEELF